MRYCLPTSCKVGPLFDFRSSTQCKATVMEDSGEVLRTGHWVTNKQTKYKKCAKVSEHQRQLFAVIQGRVTHAYLLHTANKIQILYSQKWNCAAFSYIFERVIYSHDCCTYFKLCRRPGWKFLSDIADSAKDFVALSLTSCFKFFSVVGDSIHNILSDVGDSVLTLLAMWLTAL